MSPGSKDLAVGLEDSTTFHFPNLNHVKHVVRSPPRSLVLGVKCPSWWCASPLRAPLSEKYNDEKGDKRVIVQFGPPNRGAGFHVHDNDDIAFGHPF